MKPIKSLITIALVALLVGCSSIPQAMTDEELANWKGPWIFHIPNCINCTWVGRPTKAECEAYRLEVSDLLDGSPMGWCFPDLKYIGENNNIVRD